MVKKKVQEQDQEVEEKKTLKKEYIHAVGRRKESVARVRLYSKGEKVGQIVVNDKPIDLYFSLSFQKILYMKPFTVKNTENKFGATIKVSGGGLKGQLEAVVHGLSRAIEKYDRENYRLLLKKHGLLTRDARVRQRRMIGMGGKSRRKKQSPKR